MSSLSNTLTQHDEAISATLATFFVHRIAGARTIHPRYELLWQELSRVTLNGGKRLRSKMTILAYEAFGGTDTATIIPLAAAQEILHSSLLIHDDIIDHELTRRSQPNVSGAYMRDHYAEVNEPTIRRHHSDSAALLGGDLLLVATFELMDSSQLSSEQLLSVRSIFYRIIFEVAGGQLLDSEMAFLARNGVSAETIARYKTASYSYIGPLLVGATVAGASDDELRELEVFATNIGIAFQLHDDVLGVFGDEEKTGKSTSGDLREGKKTYLVEQFLDTASAAHVATFRASFGNPELTDITAGSLKDMLRESGALDKTNVEIDRRVAEARSALDRLHLDTHAHQMFEMLITLSTKRET